MGEKNMKKPEIIVFAGPNGSGKSTVTALAKTIGVYVNADDIKKAVNCSDLEAAEQAENLDGGS
jgi:predicted ABC-type ATPase